MRAIVLRVLRALGRPRALFVALVLGTLVSVPAIMTGWFNDDFVMRLLLGEGVEAYPLSPLQLYEFTTPDVPVGVAVEQGYLAWFTSPELTLRFFRPLSSASLWLGGVLFGRNALLEHLHHMAWFLGLVVVVGRLHRRVLRPTAAGLATVLYAIASYHGMTVAWVAARHVLVGGFFAALTILLHVGWRQSGERWRGVGAAIAFALGLLASEASLGAVVFVVLYEAIAREDSPRRRASSALPTVALALAHLAYYAQGGWGATHSGTYVSPFSDPIAYLAIAAERVPVLLGEAFGGVPSEVYGFAPLRPLLVGWGVLTSVVVVLLLRLDRIDRRDRWLLASTALSLAPVVGGFIGGRLLVVAGIGSSALVSLAIVRALQRASRPGGLSARAGLALLVVLQLVVSPLGRIAFELASLQMAKAEEEHARSLDLEACGGARLLYSLTGGDPSNSMYLESSALFYTPERIGRFEAVRALSMALTEQRFTRLDERTFTLEILGDRVVGPIESVHYDVPPAVGSTRTVGEMTVHVTAGTDDSWTAARFEIDRPLEDVCFGSWDGKRLQLWRAPAIGESRVLPHEPGIMGM